MPTFVVRNSPSGEEVVIPVPDVAPSGMGAFCPAETNSTVGNRRVRSVAGTGSFEFDFTTPGAYDVATGAISLIGFANGPGAVGPLKNITLNSDYGVLGQLLTQFGSTDTRDYVIPADKILFAVDLLPVLGSIAPNQWGGVQVDHNGIGGAIAYLGIDVSWIG